METYGSWLNNTLESFAAYKQTLSNKEVKKYKLDYLARVQRGLQIFPKNAESVKNSRVISQNSPTIWED